MQLFIFTVRRVCIALTMPWQDVCLSVCHTPGLCLRTWSHSSHLAVEIFLQNHGYTFHPEDLEKGQGDSRWKAW